MVNESTVYTSNSTPHDNSQHAECPHCNHKFNTGNIKGDIFCIACGKKFDSSKHIISQTSSSTKRMTSASDSSEVKTTSTNLNESIRHGKHSSFGDYTIIEEVARGGMGVVYKAKHKTLKRIVALKVLKSADDASEEDIKRFIQEAKAAAILKHPNIVQIHNFDVHRGLHFFTMDFIEGTPLDQMLESGPLPPYKACELMRSIAESIAYAHKQGVIHRDIKPGNVIIDTDGRPMLTDFGLAINLTNNDSEDRMTKSGAIMGTLPYIAPEQAAGKVDEIGPLSDIYSLGALFYELITGKPPFTGMTQFELLKQIINHYPIQPRKINPRLNKDLDTIIMKCLAKEPYRRYQSAEDLMSDCNSFLNGNIIMARPSSLLYKIRLNIKRRPATSIMIGSLIIISIFTLIVINYAQGTAEKLIESKAQQAQIKKDKNILGAMLKRDWRGEYTIKLKNTAKVTTNLTESSKNKIGWLNSKLAKLTPDGLIIKADKNQNKVAFGAPVSLPSIFHVNFKVYTPEIGMGKVKIYSGLDKTYKIKSSTRVIELGVEGRPGAKILRGDTVLAEDGSFTLKPKAPHNISVYRDTQNKLIIIQVDGKEIIKLKISDESSTGTDSYIGISTDNGEFTLLSMQISVLGMNQEMIKSSLRLADSLASEPKDREAAKVLYKKILKERSDHSTLLKAYSGYIKTLRGNERDIIYECNNLADSITQSRSRFLELGEREYLIGIALANHDNSKAIEYFNQSFNHAYRNALKDIAPTSTMISKAFTDTEKPDINKLFKDKDVTFADWHTIKPAKNALGYFDISNITTKGIEKYYIKQSYILKENKHIVIYLDSNTDKLFINNKEFTNFLDDKGRDRRYAITDLLAGENTIILEHIVKNASEHDYKTIQLRIRDHNLKYSNVYGLLARIEEALLELEESPDAAVKQITVLQNDYTLEYLKKYYPAELKSREILKNLLNAVDNMLKKTEEYSKHAWILLEAARTISDTVDGSELATRYNTLAESLVNSGNLTQANDLFTQAITLLPDWYTPQLNRAELLYRQEDFWFEGVSAFDKALTHLPNSLELRLEVARFYLNPGFELTPNPSKKLEPIPERAFLVAEEAVKLSNRNSPEALTLCAEALEIMGKKAEALHYIQEAILLESSKERKEMLKRLNK